MAVVPHPDAEQLTAYLLGKLSWAELERVESHLAGCPDCRSRTSQLEGRADSFVSCLRGAGDTQADDPALDRLVAGARALMLPTVSPGELEPPKVVAGCVVIDEKGIPGGLGIVYKARHAHLKVLRAIKRPKSRDDLDRANLLTRFRREVEAVGDLDDRHVVRAHDAGTDDEGPYLVMEWLDGEPLSRLVGRHGPLPVPEACELVREAALGLQAAHERGLVHRDVKPSNLMLARARPAGARAVVIDWGLVKRTNEAVPVTPPPDGPTVPGTAMGTADYMAPEQARDAGSVDGRADVYSLGVTLYFLLAGKPPFHGRPVHEKLLAHQHEAFPPLGRLRSDIPGEVLAVLEKMVEKDPARRYATPGEAANALRPFCCPESGLLPLLPGGPPRAGLPIRTSRVAPRGRRLVGLLAAAASVLLVAGALGLMLRDKSSPSPTEPGDQPTVPVRMNGEHAGACLSMAFMPDGLRAVSESGGGGVYFWDVEKHCLEDRRLHGFEQPAKDQESSGVVAVSPVGRYVVAAFRIPPFGHMNYLQIYDEKTKEVGKEYAFFAGTMGRALAFSPDGSRLATLDLPGLFGLPAPTIRIIEVPSGKGWKQFPCGKGVETLAYAPDGTVLAFAGSDKTIRLRNPEHERPEREFRGHEAAVDQVAFSEDGKRLFSASGGDGTLRVWNNDKDAGAVVEKEGTKIDAGKMLCTAFWPGGRALTGHADGSVVLWDLATGKEVTRFAHPGARVTAVAISPDGRQGLAALSDHLVYLYRLPQVRGRP